MLFFESLHVLIFNSFSRKPLLVVLEFNFHLFKIDQHIVINSLFSEMVSHPAVVAVLKLLLNVLLIVVKIFVEVWHIFIGEFKFLHAVFKYYTTGCLVIQTLIVTCSRKMLNCVYFHCIFSTWTSCM